MVAIFHHHQKAEDMFNPAHSEEMGFEPLGTCEWNRSLMRFQKTEKFCCGKYPQRYTHPGKHFQSKVERPTLGGPFT